MKRGPGPSSRPCAFEVIPWHTAIPEKKKELKRNPAAFQTHSSKATQATAAQRPRQARDACNDPSEKYGTQACICSSAGPLQINDNFHDKSRPR